MFHGYSVEKLYHFQCGHCSGWWSISDWKFKDDLCCPHCERPGTPIDQNNSAWELQCRPFHDFPELKAALVAGTIKKEDYIFYVQGDMVYMNDAKGHTVYSQELGNAPDWLDHLGVTYIQLKP
jgi:hypothetical protein